MGEPVDTIVVRKPCGHVTFMVVNEPDVMSRATRAEIGALVAAGCTVEHMPVEEARRQVFRCDCERKEAKGQRVEMFSDSP
ncbi:MAG: hypothetical protein ACYTKD_29635 [Planctomycetota bacterium]|jgi:hypothetical protein